MATNQKLQETISNIELARQMLAVSWDGIALRNRESDMLQKAHHELLESYQELQQQQNQTLSQLETVKAEHNELKADLNIMTKLVNEYQSIFSSPVVDMEKTEKLEARVQELEAEKAELIEAHRNALVVAADRISALERKMAEGQSLQCCSLGPEGRRSVSPEKKRLRSRRRSKKAKLSVSQTAQ